MNRFGDVESYISAKDSSPGECLGRGHFLPIRGVLNNMYLEVRDVLLIEVVREVYAGFAEKHDTPPLHENTRGFGTKIGKYCEVIQKREDSIAYPKRGDCSYLGLTLTEKGLEYLDE